MISLYLVVLLACAGETEATPEPAPAEEPEAAPEPKKPGGGGGGGGGGDITDVDCNATIVSLSKSEIGEVFKVKCPSGCASSSAPYGTDVYSGDSRVCIAGIHAGAITDAGGPVKVTVSGESSAFKGSERHGVTSRDWSSSWSPTMTIIGKKPGGGKKKK